MSLINYDDKSNEYIQWKLKFGKNYNNQVEDVRRYKIWRDNDEFITKHNSEYMNGLHTYKVGHNKYSDLCSHEYANILKGHKSKNFKFSNAPHGNGVPLPTDPHQFNFPNSSNFTCKKNNNSQCSNMVPSIDWREKGFINPVRDQGPCGSCYAFSALGALEGQFFLKTGRLIKLSEQSVVDCSIPFGNGGCIGGTMEMVFTYVKENGGINTEESYPYEAKQSICRSLVGEKVPIRVNGFVNIPCGDEYSLTQAVANVGPVSVAIDARQRSFQLYESGIYFDPKCTQIPDHAVLVVGYGSEGPGKDYYIVKNSWGPSWGENGYVKLPRNIGNFAGIATNASYPIISVENDCLNGPPIPLPEPVPHPVPHPVVPAPVPHPPTNQHPVVPAPVPHPPANQYPVVPATLPVSTQSSVSENYAEINKTQQIFRTYLSIPQNAPQIQSPNYSQLAQTGLYQNYMNSFFMSAQQPTNYLYYYGIPYAFYPIYV